MLSIKSHAKFLLVLWALGIVLHGSAQTLDKDTFYSEIPHPDTKLLKLKAQYNSAVEKQQMLDAGLYLQQMGQLCFHFGHYPQALELHLQANKVLKSQQKPLLLADNLCDLGLLYYYLRNPNAAQQQYQEALQIFQKQKEPSGIAKTYGRLGHLYEKQGKYPVALDFQRKAINEYQKAGNQSGIAKIYENLGSIFEDLSRYDSAYFYFNKALSVNEVAKDELSQIEVINNLGDVLRKTGKTQEGLHYSRKALLLSQELKEKYQEASAYRDISRALHDLGRNDSAYYYLELSRKMTMDIYSEKSMQQMAVLQVMYDIAKKNAEIERLDHATKTNQIVGIAVAVVLVLLGSLGFVIMSRQRMKIANELHLNQQNQKVSETEQALMQAALRNQQLEEEYLKNQLEIKTQELSAHTLHVIQKNQLLQKLYLRLEETLKDDRKNVSKNLKQIMQEIHQSFTHDHDWEHFRHVFEQVHQRFLEKLKSHTEQLTSNDIRLIALLKMNLNSAEIASLLGVSQDSLRVLRYRLRKKLNLAQGENLSSFIQSL
ncbi:tetratricopeptide repeat protein [Emticicia sp. ODNR4P]|nr:tetratricopeptide repeat protein [Emticicia sp. ODNR4P]